MDAGTPAKAFPAACDEVCKSIEQHGMSPTVLSLTNVLVGLFYDMPNNSVGGELHTVLDDTNMGSESIEACIADAETAGDCAAVALGRLLLAIPPLQRLDLDCVCTCGCADEERELLAGEAAVRPGEIPS